MNRCSFTAGRSWTVALPLIGATLAIAAAMLTGCGSSDNNNPNIPNPTNVTSLTQAQKTPPTNSTANGAANLALNGTQLMYWLTDNGPNNIWPPQHTSPG